MRYYVVAHVKNPAHFMYNYFFVNIYIVMLETQELLTASYQSKAR